MHVTSRTGIFPLIVMTVLLLQAFVLPACSGSAPATPPAATPSPTLKTTPAATVSPATKTTPAATVSPAPAASATTKPAQPQTLSGKLPISHAGSLTVPFNEVNKEFMRQNPGVEIVTDAGGSAAIIRKVTEQGKEAGIVASADYKLIPNMMIPKQTDWYVVFASNQIVLCYTDKSRFGDQVNAGNWYDVLRKDGVTYGRSNPDQDPAGYRTLMVWQLAAKYHNQPNLYDTLLGAPGDKMKATAAEMVALLKDGTLDYAFEYDSVAKQNNLKYVAFPDEINLSSKKFEDSYSQAKVDIKGAKPGETVSMMGEPILYAVTVPKAFANQELAFAWLKFLLSDRAIGIMEAVGQSSIKPALASDPGKLPEALRNLAR